MFLPGKALIVDFVLVPAAQIEGTLVDSDDKPIAHREIVLTGDRLPQSCTADQRIGIHFTN